MSYTNQTDSRYKFTEKERDLGTNYDYFGARYYDSELGRWQSVDPMAAKYPGWSPYNYCINNPLRIIDPDGMEVRIYTGETDENGNPKYITYENGMKYEGDNKFVSTVVNALNKMGSVKFGGDVLSSLIESKNAFSFQNVASSGGSNTIQFVASENGGGAINAAAMLSFTDETNLENVSHELYHGYQTEHGGFQGVNSEVEAYLFGRGVLSTSYHALFGISGNGSSAGNQYAGAMDNLMLSDKFNKVDFNTAVNSFKAGTPAGDLYKNLRVHKNFSPTIDKFFPLFR
jgi:RHS repeat-associated protein